VVLCLLGDESCGAHGCSPRCEQEEFTKALFDVIGATSDDKGAQIIRERAKAVAEVVVGKRSATGTKYGPIISEAMIKKTQTPGRDIAADWLIEYARKA
jgi:hypothetical protein